MWQWSDGTTALYYNIFNRNVPAPAFASFRRSKSDFNIIMNDEPFETDVLCEIPVKSDQQKNSVISLPIPEVLASAIAGMSECSDQAAVWTFLGCDVTNMDSAAVTDFRSGDVCGSDKPPPAGVRFSCDDGSCVPYTLVCDFRHDCMDESDENFCDFPPCSMGQIACDDGKQARDLLLCVPNECLTVLRCRTPSSH